MLLEGFIVDMFGTNCQISVCARSLVDFSENKNSVETIFQCLQYIYTNDDTKIGKTGLGVSET